MEWLVGSRSNSVSNSIPRAVDFWVDSILQGYITEFTVEDITSVVRVKEIFSKDPEEDICYVSVHGSRCSFMRRVSWS